MSPGPTPRAVHSALEQKLQSGSAGRKGLLAFAGLFVIGIIYVGTQIMHDLSQVHPTAAWPYILLGIALLIALGFEFVNGFHDTANAVATVIYTHSLEPHLAVMWSGTWNFIGVMMSSGAVAYTIVSLLPVELILQVGAGAGFAMVFALLIAAILWNLGTWSLGLPASSTHTLIGSIIGVGLANQLMATKTHTSGVDWSQAWTVFKALLVSPVFGFVFAGLFLLILKRLVKDERLYKAPEGNQPPPFWIRATLIFTCTAVSWAHGSNDGQKGMGLIMLILIGTVPTAYALNHAIGPNQVQDFVAVSEQAMQTVTHAAQSGAVQTPAANGEKAAPSPSDRVAAGAPQHSLTAPAAANPPQVDQATEEVTRYISTRQFTPATLPAVGILIRTIETNVQTYKALKDVPADQQRNVRNDMYLVSESFRVINKTHAVKFSPQDDAAIANYKAHLDKATKFIPTWVKVAVALALGMGTMIGWKRIVITVGEKIGKQHLTYGQGMSAEIVAASTIIAADHYHLPVSTTHVLSSGVAGTMAANRSGIDFGTVRNIAAAWIFTLPAAALLSGFLFWVFRHFV